MASHTKTDIEEQMSYECGMRPFTIGDRHGFEPAVIDVSSEESFRAPSSSRLLARTGSFIKKPRQAKKVVSTEIIVVSDSDDELSGTNSEVEFDALHLTVKPPLCRSSESMPKIASSIRYPVINLTATSSEDESPNFPSCISAAGDTQVHITDASSTVQQEYIILTDSDPEVDSGKKSKPAIMKTTGAPRSYIDHPPPLAATNTVATPGRSCSTNRGKKTPSKKAQRAAEQERRAAYAATLFKELNENVFNNGLPTDTILRWNVRLLTTAGRATFKRSKGQVQASIDLATKILDNDQRIRNTLAHEMCHLASWVIDGKLDENHGKIFKKWSRELVRKWPDIKITTRHNYDIAHPYEWTCALCAKIHGRFSNSIDVEKCRCPCGGKLVAMFEIRTLKTPKNKNVKSSSASSTNQEELLGNGDVSDLGTSTPASIDTVVSPSPSLSCKAYDTTLDKLGRDLQSVVIE